MRIEAAILLTVIWSCSASRHEFGDGADVYDASSNEDTLAVDNSTDDGADAPVDCSNVPRCEGAIAHVCGIDGGDQSQDCSLTGAECVSGVGCQLCVPGALGCDPTEPAIPRTCTADGLAWRNEVPCGPGLACSAGTCVDACADAASRGTAAGCEFWFTTTIDNRLVTNGTDSHPFGISVAHHWPWPVHVHVEQGAGVSVADVDVPANGGTRIDLPWVLPIAQIQNDPAHPVNGGYSAELPGGAHHVTTTAPIVLWTFNPIDARAPPSDPGEVTSQLPDATRVRPSPLLGQDYVTLEHAHEQSAVTLGEFVAIIGTADATTVSLDLRGSTRATTDGSIPALMPGPTTFVVGRGDVVELISVATGASPCDTNELTGTSIHASAPVAVFDGDDATTVPCGAPAGDRLEQQSVPMESWGTRYAVSTFQDRGAGEPHIVRVLAAQDRTAVQFDPPVHDGVVLNARESVEFETSQDFEVVATGPIAVAQFMVGANEFVTADHRGDPSMVYVLPIERWSPSSDFFAPDTFEHTFVNITGIASLHVLLDGAAPTGTSRPVGTGGDVAWTQEIGPGIHHFWSPDGGRFEAKVYGVGPWLSYAVTAGEAASADVSHAR